MSWLEYYSLMFLKARSPGLEDLTVTVSAYSPPDCCFCIVVFPCAYYCYYAFSWSLLSFGSVSTTWFCPWG